MKASRRVRIVALRCRWLTSAMVSTWRSPRPYETSVGRPRMTSRKCPASPDIAFQRLSVSSAVFAPMSAAKSGRRGTVRTTMTADDQSTKAMATMASSGTTAAWMRLGRKRAAYGSTAVQPCAASVLACAGSGRLSAGALSQWSMRRSRRAAATRIPAQAWTVSARYARSARVANSRTSSRAGRARSPRPTTSTMRSASTKTRAIVAIPWRMPRTPSAATGPRVPGTSRSIARSKGFIAPGLRGPSPEPGCGPW